MLLVVAVTLSVVFFLLLAAVTLTVTSAFLPFFTETVFFAALSDLTAFFVVEGFVVGAGVGSAGAGVGSAGLFAGS